jgi:hypothetical protein
MNPGATKLERRLLRGGLFVVALCIATALFWPQQFFHSYLLAYLFWFGIVLGSLAILLLYHLTGGTWGAVIRRFLESAIHTIPLLAVLFLPIVAGLYGGLYTWTYPKAVASSEVLQRKTLYLNPPFFLLRAAIYFIVWIALLRALEKWSRRQDEQPVPEALPRLNFIGGIGLLLYGLTVTFASVDWMMSLEPEWFSTMYGLMVISGQVLSAFAFVICVATILAKSKPFSEIISVQQFHDLGNLTLAFVMIWAYLAFSQFLIIWSGNLPEETPWYIHRLYRGWQAVGIGLIVFHFALPFLLLLSRQMKRQSRLLAPVAVGILVMRLVDLFWMIAPDFYQKGIGVHLLDLILPPAVGAIWLSFFLKELRSRPVVVRYDPNLPAVNPAWREGIEHG